MKKKIIYGISSLQGGVLFEYRTYQGNAKKAMFTSVAKAEKVIDTYLKDAINDFIVCVIGERIDPIYEEDTDSV